MMATPICPSSTEATPPKQPVSVLVVVHTMDQAFLLLRRTGPGALWQSITGSREGNEPLAHTATRELAEETGLRAHHDYDPSALVDWRISNRYLILPQWRHRYAAGVTHNTEHLFSLCLPHSLPVRLAPEEHTEACWRPWAEAAAQVFSWTNRDAIRLLATRQPEPAPAPAALMRASRQAGQ
jgi:dihydroneopterin triphosphate diphosphatase